MFQQNIIIHPRPEGNNPHQNPTENLKQTKKINKGKRYFEIFFNCFPQMTCKQTKTNHPNHPNKQSGKNLVWCFRKALTSPSILSYMTTNQARWTRFEPENERKLTRQYYSSFSDSIDIQDRNILNGSVSVRVILQEAIAFAVDPDWSEPINFEIVSYPKQNWIRRW
ncbi:hypothetical protein CU098_008312, partial [Rhizopus stolonifer]